MYHGVLKLQSCMRTLDLRWYHGTDLPIAQVNRSNTFQLQDQPRRANRNPRFLLLQTPSWEQWYLQCPGLPQRRFRTTFVVLDLGNIPLGSTPIGRWGGTRG